MSDGLIVGRIVHLYTKNKKRHWGGAEQGPYAAIVTFVHDPVRTLINVWVPPNHEMMIPYIEMKVAHRDSALSKDALSWWEWPHEHVHVREVSRETAG